MHKRLTTGFLAAFVISSACYVSAADFKSEESLIDESREPVEREMKKHDDWSHQVVMDKKPAPVAAKRPQITEKPIVVEKPAVSVKPVAKIPLEADKPAPAAAAAVSQDIEQPDADVVTIDPESGTVTKTDKEAIGEDVEFVPGVQQPQQVKPLVEPILKKMDVERIGASPYYETYEGLRLLKYFTVAQRVEIYQEARPVDSYILDAFAIPKVRNDPWNQKSDFRTQLTPVFTRAYGTEITMSDPKNKEGQIRYTHDYRDIYRNYYPKYPDIKVERWDQNEILFMHAKQIDPIGWSYASNLGYRYSTMNAKVDNPNVPDDKSYYEVRHTYYGSLSLAPTEKLEWFGQAEYYKSMHVKATYDNRPDHYLARTELRIKSNDMKTMYVPSFSYSKDYFYPFDNTYQKYEIQYRVGRDWAKRFSSAHTLKYVMGFRDEPDNKGPTYGTYKNPFKDKAYAVSLENRFSYNVYDRLYLQAGIDLNNGLNWSIFDNYGLLAGLEYYAPGMIRVDVGWTGHHYYNLQDFLSAVYFKFYLFM